MSLTPLKTNIDVVTCEGAPREMGRAQGEALRELIHAARRDLMNLEAFRLQQPRWLHFYPVYRWLAEQKAGRYLARALATTHSGADLRLLGIAEGAGLGVKPIALFNAMEPLLSSVGGCTACPGACSAVAVRGRRSTIDGPIIARNFDYLQLVQPYHTIRECRPSGGLRSIEFTTAPLVGAIDGMNEEGLCITYNYAFAMDEPGGPAPSISMVIGEALSRCSNVVEAAGWIASRPRWGAGLLMLADATGDIASLELSSTRSHLRRPAAGEDILFHTNAYSSPEMKAIQAPWDSVYTDRAPVPLRGHRLHESSSCGINVCPGSWLIARALASMNWRLSWPTTARVARPTITRSASTAPTGIRRPVFSSFPDRGASALHSIRPATPNSKNFIYEKLH